MAGDDVALPDPTNILPYLGLFTIVALRPDDLVGCSITTPHLPGLSHQQDNRFLPAPPGTSPADENVARIFDVLAVAAGNPPISYGAIPLSPEHPQFQQQRYWRLPVKTEAVLAVLIDRTIGGTYESPEIQNAQNIADISRLMNRGLRISRPSAHDGPPPPPGGGSGGGPNGGNGGGGGDGPSGMGGARGSGAHGDDPGPLK